MKKIIVLLAVTLLTISVLCSCGNGTDDEQKINTVKLEGEIIKIPNDALSYERLLIESDNYVTSGLRYELFGMETVAEYYYGLALSGVSSLRLAIENVIYLKDKDIDMLELQAGTGYTNWNEIAETSFASFWPAYFEGLICEFQGKNDDAAKWYEIAKDNPLYYETDFYYLKSWSVDDLNSLHEICLEKEADISDKFIPKSKLQSTERTGAEYMPDYHLFMMEKFGDSDESFIQAAVNYLSVTPFDEDGYCFLYLAYLNADDTDNALYYLNDGYYANPDGELINYYMGASLYAVNDYENARKCLEISAASEKPELAEKAEYLLSMMK